MKKTFLYIALASVALISCRKDDTPTVTPEVSIETQNTYDDQSAQKFLDTHYLDARGNIKDLKDTDTTNVKLSKLNPVKLPSGVIYITRVGAQPDPGTAVGTNDVITLMSSSTSYMGANIDNKVSFVSPAIFRNTISGNANGQPEVDPEYFYVKNSRLKAFNEKYKTTYDHSYFEIEGFREALQKFKSFDIPDDSNYNLQGVIIVPSRAAFARDPHYNYTGISYRNRSFVFNFQLWKTAPRVND